MSAAAGTGPEALSRAHSLSAEAHALLDTSPILLSTLRTALDKYTAALTIYEATAHATTFNGTQSRDKTLDLLISQHRRLVRDVERKIDAAERLARSNEHAGRVRAADGTAAVAVNGMAGVGGRAGSVPGPSAFVGSGGQPRRISRRSTEPAGPSGAGTQAGSGGANITAVGTSAGSPPSSMTGIGIGLASLAHPPPPSRPGFMASRTSFSSAALGPGTGSIGSGVQPRGLPPFARPPSSTSTPSNLAVNPNAFVSHARRPQAVPSLSPLYSSTSSSEPGESFITVRPHGSTSTTGHAHKVGGPGMSEMEQDPFNRFWAMLDGALENISRPVAFASAPIGREGVDVQGLTEGLADVRLDRDGEGVAANEARRDPSPSSPRSPKSPSDSFYLIPHSSHPSHPSLPSTHLPAIPLSSTATSSAAQRARTQTPEELALENEHLRASLDALAVHASGIEKENEALKRGIRGREDLLRSVVGEVRQEAERARIDQSILASQLIPAPPTRHALTRDRTRSSSNVPASAAIDSSARVAELEAQLAMMREENEKQAAQIIKYKDRFERIKANARAKRDARDG